MPTNKILTFTDIVTSTESCALDMEHNHKENEAETLRQNDKGCGFVIVTNDTAKEKNRKTTRQSNKSKNRSNK